MPVAQYHPYVNALQWIGTNITEIRQFIRANPEISGASVDGSNNLILTMAVVPPNQVIVPVNNWLVSSWNTVQTFSPTDFAAHYNVGG